MKKLIIKVISPPPEKKEQVIEVQVYSTVDIEELVNTEIWLNANTDHRFHISVEDEKHYNPKSEGEIVADWLGTSKKEDE
jgi:hypothetical protein